MVTIVANPVTELIITVFQTVSNIELLFMWCNLQMKFQSTMHLVT